MPHPCSDSSRKHAASSRISGPRRSLQTAVRRRSWLLAVAIGSCLLLLPTSALAEPTEAEQRAKVEKLATKAEIITEKYNGQRLELEKARKQAKTAQKRSKNAHQRYREARAEIAAIAAAQYRSGGIRQPWVMMTSGNPQDFIDRAAMVNHLARQKAARIGSLQSTIKRSERAERKAEATAKKVKQLTEEMAQKKEKIEELVADAEAKLEEIEEENAAASRDYQRAPIDRSGLGSGVAAQAVEIALAQQGDPYVWGAVGPDSFDCSGLIVYAYGQVGVQLPHYTGALWDSYPHVSRSEMRPGDLVFTSAHHVGIYIGNGQMVNAPNSTTVVQVEDIYQFYGAVRVV